MAFISIAFLSVFMWVAAFMMIVLFGGTLVLQIFLSKMKNPWVGLILPGITFAVALRICLMAPDFSTFFLLFYKCNIATLIYLVIYLFSRLRRRKKKQIRLRKKRLRHKKRPNNGVLSFSTGQRSPPQ